MRIVFVIFFLISVQFPGYGQSLRTPVSSAYQLTNTYSKTNSDVFSFTYNTAALARQQNFGVGAFGENRFLTKEMNQYTAVAGFETSKGNFGLQTDYFGYSNFNEYQIGLAFARPLSENFDIGAQFNYYSYRIPGYPQNSALTFQIGMIARLNELLSVGLQVYNPVGGYLSKVNDEKLPSNYRFGIGYEPTENVSISATLQKEEGKDINIVAGVYYQFAEQFFARAGVMTENNMPFAAAGVSFNDLRLDISVSHHAQLGFSPGVSVIYQPSKGKQ